MDRVEPPNTIVSSRTFPKCLPYFGLKWARRSNAFYHMFLGIHHTQNQQHLNWKWRAARWDKVFRKYEIFYIGEDAHCKLL